MASNSQSANAQKPADDEEQKDGGGAAQAEPETETKWKCWKCNTINLMGSKCLRCRVSFEECPYEDIERWLVSSDDVRKV